jgi:IS30 family transposase
MYETSYQQVSTETKRLLVEHPHTIKTELDRGNPQVQDHSAQAGETKSGQLSSARWREMHTEPAVKKKTAANR